MNNGDNNNNGVNNRGFVGELKKMFEKDTVNSKEADNSFESLINESLIKYSFEISPLLRNLSKWSSINEEIKQNLAKTQESKNIEGDNWDYYCNIDIDIDIVIGDIDCFDIDEGQGSEKEDEGTTSGGDNDKDVGQGSGKAGEGTTFGDDNNKKDVGQDSGKEAEGTSSGDDKTKLEEAYLKVIYHYMLKNEDNASEEQHNEELHEELHISLIEDKVIRSAKKRNGSQNDSCQGVQADNNDKDKDVGQGSGKVGEGTISGDDNNKDVSQGSGKNDEGTISGFNKNMYDDASRVINEVLSYKFDNISSLLLLPVQWDFFTKLSNSLLSGEYVANEEFGADLRKIRDAIYQDVEEFKRDKKYENEPLLRSVYTDKDSLDFNDTLVFLLSDYLNFNAFLDSQIDERDLVVLNVPKDSTSFARAIDGYWQSNRDVTYFSDIMVPFFQAMIEMTRIDQNFYFSQMRFSTLMALWEMINGGCEIRDGEEKKSGSDRPMGKGFRLLLNELKPFLPEKIFTSVKEMVLKVNVKNNLLIAKILDSCREEVVDYKYEGWSNRYVFDARKHEDTDRKNVVLLTKLDFIGRECVSKNNQLWQLYCQMPLKGQSQNDRGKRSDSEKNEEPKNEVQEYEQLFFDIRDIKADKNRFEIVCKDFFKKLCDVKNGFGGVDVRRYNSKIIEMAQVAVCDTNDYMYWLAGNYNNFDMEVASEQVRRVLSFLRSRYDPNNGKICFDSRFLVGYADWCLEFLNILVAEKPSEMHHRNIDISRISEDALFLMDYLNRLIRDLVKAIERDVYCVPFAPKYRGCFCTVDFEAKIDCKSSEKPQQEEAPIVKRVFIDNSESENFKNFVEGNEMKDRGKYVFIASAFMAPVNYERLLKKREELRTRSKIIRSEIHTSYFERVRESLKKETEEQISENRRSVIQILGIFAALLALTTVALTGTTTKQSPEFFAIIMLSFAVCLGLFILLLHMLSKGNYRQRKLYDETRLEVLSREIKQLKAKVDGTIKQRDEEKKSLSGSEKEGSSSQEMSEKEQKRLKEEIECIDKEIKKVNKNINTIKRKVRFINVIVAVCNYLRKPTVFVLVGIIVLSAVIIFLHKNMTLNVVSENHEPNISSQINVELNNANKPGTNMTVEANPSSNSHNGINGGNAERQENP